MPPVTRADYACVIALQFSHGMNRFCKLLLPFIGCLPHVFIRLLFYMHKTSCYIGKNIIDS